MVRQIVHTFLFLFIYSSTIYSQGWLVQQSNTSENLNCVFFINENVGWIVGSNGTIIHTTNKVENWNVKPSPVMKDLYSVYFMTDTDGIIVGEDGVVLKTSNGGSSWDINYIDISTYHSIFMVSEEIGWIVGDNNAIKKTTDGGISWINQDFSSTVNFSFRDVHFIDSSIGWIAGHGILEGIILRTTNGGISWDHFGGGPFFNSIKIISDLFGQAVGEYGLVMETSNGGITWFPQHDFGDDNLLSVYYRDEVTGWVSGENGLIAKTLNKGEEWIIQNSATAEQLNSITFYGEFGWVVGNSGTIMHTIDTIGGFILMDWSQIFQIENEVFHDIKFLNDTLGFCKGTGEIHKTTDSGFNWSNISMPTYVRDFMFIDINVGYVLCRETGGSNYPDIFVKTTDSGNSWEQHTLPNYGFPLNKLTFVSADIGYIIGGKYNPDLGGILKTIDGGDTWTLIYSTSSYCLDIFFITNNFGWVVSLDGKLLRTSDGGNTWIEFNNLPSGHYYEAIDIHFINENVGFVGGSYWDGYSSYTGELMKTTNGGESWEVNLSRAIIDICMVDEDYGWVAVWEHRLYFTTDGGENWESLGYEPRIEHLDFRNKDLGFGTNSYFDYNQGIFISEVFIYGEIPEPTDTTKNDTTDISVSNYLLSQNYPNPFNPNTTIKYQIPEISFITIKIYDVLGNEVATLVNEEKLAGVYEVEFDGSGLPSGIYFYQLSAGQYVETKKMVLLK
jgi:photosystem II stability/assembly factor-like uncharacterized protein